jgi:aryl-alcohol dehydrogenase-like predicted oxidoreductase
MAALQRLVEAGKALRIGISSSQQVAARVAAGGPAHLSVLQFPANLFLEPEPALRSASCLRIANHTFGGPLRARELKEKLAAMAADPLLPDALRERLRGEPETVLAQIVFSAARIETGAEWIVTSMLQPTHVHADTAAIALPPWDEQEIAAVRDYSPR